MRLRFLIVFGLSLAVSQAATYYIDSAGGRDSNSGTSANAPWKSLKNVNATVLHSGDRVVFKAGEAWKGQLAPRTSGGNGIPVRIDRYGSGPKPKIDGNGEVEDVLRLYNVQNIEVRNLEITNHGAERAVRRGVHIFLDNFGTAKHIVVAELYIYDVNGVNGNGDNAKTMAELYFARLGTRPRAVSMASRSSATLSAPSIVPRLQQIAITPCARGGTPACTLSFETTSWMM